MAVRTREIRAATAARSSRRRRREGRRDVSPTRSMMMEKPPTSPITFPELRGARESFSRADEAGGLLERSWISETRGGSPGLGTGVRVVHVPSPRRLSMRIRPKVASSFSRGTLEPVRRTHSGGDPGRARCLPAEWHVFDARSRRPYQTLRWESCVSERPRALVCVGRAAILEFDGRNVASKLCLCCVRCKLLFTLSLWSDAGPHYFR